MCARECVCVCMRVRVVCECVHTRVCVYVARACVCGERGGEGGMKYEDTATLEEKGH